MSTIFVGYFIDRNNLILHDYVGWSKSEYTVRQFLKQFNVDSNIYTPTLLKTDEDGSPELNALDIDVEFDTEITPYLTIANNAVLLTPNLYMTWLETAIDIDGPMSRLLSDTEEECMYNRLFAIVDKGIIRNEQTALAIKKLVLLLFQKYRIKMLDPYGEFHNLDHIEFMIQERYMNPLYVEKGGTKDVSKRIT